MGTDDPAAVRPVVLPRRAQPARIDHRQLRRQALHERGAAVRRGDARDLQGRGHRRLPRAGLAGHGPALPQPLPVRRPLAAPAVPGSVAQERRRGQGIVARQARRGDRRAGRCTRGDDRAVQRLRQDRQRRGLPPRRQRVRPLLRRPAREAQPVAAQHRPGPVLCRQDRPRRPRHQGRHRHRRARPRAARRRLGHRRPVRRGQRLVGRHGSHVRRSRRDDRPRHDVRLPRRRGHRARAPR